MTQLVRREPEVAEARLDDGRGEEPLSEVPGPQRPALRSGEQELVLAPPLDDAGTAGAEVDAPTFSADASPQRSPL